MPSIQLFRRVLTLALFLLSTSNSQIIIRERIAIDPRPAVQAQASSAVNATLRYELRYDGPVSSRELNFMRLQELVCGVFDSGPINSSLTVPAQSGLWNFSFRIHTPIVSNQYARFTVWLGEDVILKDSLLINCGSTCQINHQFGFRISNTFNFSANGQVFYGEQSFLNAVPSGQQHCTTQMWHPGLPVNLRVVSGQHLGQFADLNGTHLGHEVTVQGFNVDNVTFLADGVEPDSISDFVTIEASSFGITRTATIEVLRISESPIWLVMDAQGDVSYGAEMSILAQALNMFQQEVSAGSGVTYTFEIIEGSEWGLLSNGIIEANTITGVRPDDFFFRGRASIRFRARKAEPETPQRVTVRVFASNADIHQGTYSFNVLPSPLAITVSPPTVSYGQQATISVQKKNPDGTVSPWPQDAGLSYEILKGHNAGYILHPDTTRRDDFFNGQSDTIRFVALEESPQPHTVEVQLYIYVFNEGGGIATAAFDPIQPNPTLRRTGLATVTVVKGDSLDHFAVSLEKDTIAFTETSRISVATKGRDSNDVALAGDALLQFSIDSTQYGSFIKANGDTVSSPLSNVFYSDAQAGHIRFAAVSKNPDSAISFRVIARLQADTTKSGDTTLVLLEQTLKIVMAEPREVRPTIPVIYDGPGMEQARRKTFEIRMTRGGEPVNNHPFRIWTDYVRRSGGHDHGTAGDTVRPDNNDNYGYFLALGSPRQMRPLDSLTQFNGVALVYHSSVWGDTMKIYLASTTNRLLKDSVQVLERVQNLQLLSGEHYVKTGGTCNHHGPRTDTLHSNCRTPDQNHWIYSPAVADMDSAASSFRRDRNNRTGILKMNDLSLPFGGLFDINGTWTPPHGSHRNGKDVDIENTNLTVLRRHLSRFGWHYVPESPGHFPHFRYRR